MDGWGGVWGIEGTDSHPFSGRFCGWDLLTKVEEKMGKSRDNHQVDMATASARQLVLTSFLPAHAGLPKTFTPKDCL